MTRLLCFLLFAALAGAQTQNDIQGTDSGAYVHNPEWDLTPFQLFQLRKKQQGVTVTAKHIEPAAVPVQAAVIPAAVQPAAAPAVAPQVFRSGENRAAAAAFQSFPVQQQQVVQQRPAVRQQQQQFAVQQQLPVVRQQQQQQQFAVQQQLPAATQAQFQLSTDFRPQPVPVAPVAAARFQPAVSAAAVPAPQQTPDFIAAATGHPDPNFWSRSWSYSAPTYAAKAEGSSYSYIAQF